MHRYTNTRRRDRNLSRGFWIAIFPPIFQSRHPFQSSSWTSFRKIGGGRKVETRASFLSFFLSFDDLRARYRARGRLGVWACKRKSSSPEILNLCEIKIFPCPSCVYISNKEELFSFSKKKTLLTSYLGYARQN